MVREPCQQMKPAANYRGKLGGCRYAPLEDPSIRAMYLYFPRAEQVHRCFHLQVPLLKPRISSQGLFFIVARLLRERQLTAGLSRSTGSSV